MTSLNRRTILQGAAATGALIAAPGLVRAQAPAIKIGILQPVTGALAQDGEYGRLGAEIALNEINAAGGIKSMGGARLQMVFGDARSNPEGGTAEVERMQGEGVAAIVGGFASPIVLASSQAASRYDIPYICDVGVSDQIVGRGLKNTFRFGPGFGNVTSTAIENLVKLNDAAGKAAKTVVIVHEDGLFGSGMAKLLQTQLPPRGFEILETIAHPTPSRDMSNVALRIRALNPDLVIPSSYYAEFVLLSRTMQQQRIRPKGIYAILNGAASNFRFVKEFPDAANLVMDCNHWADPRKPKTAQVKALAEQGGRFWLYNTPLNYSCVRLLADAIERAGSADRGKITEALAASTFSDHIMPYGPTKFVNGQNMGAGPVNTQVQNGDIKVIFPAEFADAKPVFPAV
ncbi:MAG: ABC transporter substrate-binding protein [Beijerinckiaceae bacterium]|jgi:branched-chain amino acid transport system substrate-binding protein|nr:ABC transporter substrate-binding protein [Beijerinckiaceae bacterium]